MDPKKAKSIFLHAVEQLSPNDWPGYLGEACGDDAQLRLEITASRLPWGKPRGGGIPCLG